LAIRTFDFGRLDDDSIMLRADRIYKFIAERTGVGLGVNAESS
jgi:hypothetical protein